MSGWCVVLGRRGVGYLGLQQEVMVLIDEDSKPPVRLGQGEVGGMGGHSGMLGCELPNWLVGVDDSVPFT